MSSCYSTDCDALKQNFHEYGNAVRAFGRCVTVAFATERTVRDFHHGLLEVLPSVVHGVGGATHPSHSTDSTSVTATA